MEALPRTADRARRFPADFVWGAATAAYQIEGAARSGGRGESIWDRFSHTPGRVLNDETGDVACDHYHRYRDDVALMADLGLSAYRFSVSWPRVIPAGRGAVNPPGLGFYDRLVDELLARDIVPYVTLYHWDLPQPLEDAGGWPERATAHAFAEFAGVVAGRLGDRVRHFATINEPHIVADHGYRTGSHAPGRVEPDAALAAAHHLLVGHGLGVEAIRAQAPSASVGIVLNFEPKHPASHDDRDLEAAALADRRFNRWYLDPIVARGYPDDGLRTWAWSGREVLPGDLDVIATPIDFLGVNYYSREIVRAPSLAPPPQRAPVERTDMGWEVFPEGLTDVLRFVASRTGDLPLFVTENGAAYEPDPTDPARDPRRVDFLRRHLEAALDGLEAGLPLRGYFVWSLLDNFEWARGYSARFGIVHVDYATQARLVRDSGRFYSRVVETGFVDGQAASS